MCDKSTISIMKKTLLLTYSRKERNFEVESESLAFSGLSNLEAKIIMDIIIPTFINPMILSSTTCNVKSEVM